MSNTDDAIVSPPFCVHQRSSAVETHIFSPFSLWLTLRSGHADHSPFHLLRLGLRTSFRADSVNLPRHCPPPIHPARIGQTFVACVRSSLLLRFPSGITVTGLLVQHSVARASMWPGIQRSFMRSWLNRYATLNSLRHE